MQSKAENIRENTLANVLVVYL